MSIENNKIEIVNINSDYNKVSKNIINFLISLGFSPNFIGFDIIKDATIMLMQDRDKYRSFTKCLYKDLGIIHNKNASQIERSIRYSIEKAFERNKEMIDKEVMGNAYDKNKSKPTNSEFLLTFSLVVIFMEKN